MAAPHSSNSTSTSNSQPTSIHELHAKLKAKPIQKSTTVEELLAPLGPSPSGAGRQMEKLENTVREMWQQVGTLEQTVQAQVQTIQTLEQTLQAQIQASTEAQTQAIESQTEALKAFMASLSRNGGGGGGSSGSQQHGTTVEISARQQQPQDVAQAKRRVRVRVLVDGDVDSDGDDAVDDGDAN